jgi:hypothetical protein
MTSARWLRSSLLTLPFLLGDFPLRESFCGRDLSCKRRGPVRHPPNCPGLSARSPRSCTPRRPWGRGGREPVGSWPWRPPPVTGPPGFPGSPAVPRQSGPAGPGVAPQYPRSATRVPAPVAPRLPRGG